MSASGASVAAMSLDFLAHLRADAARFAEVLRDADPAAPVPTCPDWTADDLLWHLAEVFLFWGTIVRDRLDDPDVAEARKPERPAERTGLLALYARAGAALIDTLTNTPGDVPVWTWSDDNSAGFVRRRMAHEAVIHRLDAELTAGDVTDIDAAFATDGAHEALQHFFGAPPWSSYEPNGPVGQVVATDTGAAWLVQVGSFSGLSPNSGKTYVREPCVGLTDVGVPVFTVEATARDLDAWLWNRPALEAPTVEGSEEAFGALADVITAGVQ